MPRKFAVGDKVRVLMDKVPKYDHEWMLPKLGDNRVGVVDSYTKGLQEPYRIVFDDATSTGFIARELELVRRKT